MPIKRPNKFGFVNISKTAGRTTAPVREEKPKRKDLIRQEKVVPLSWNQGDYERNMKELEAKIENQKKYLQHQQDKIKTNEELLNHMKKEETEPESTMQKYTEEVGRLGGETGGFEMEIKYYSSLAQTSDISNNMAEQSYTDSMKYGKSLEKSLKLLKDKTRRLHDNKDAIECKDALLHLREEMGRQDVLLARMGWYQDNIQRCQPQVYQLAEEKMPTLLQQDASRYVCDQKRGIRACVLPGIAIQSPARAPSPPVATNMEFPRQFKLPVIGGDHQRSHNVISTAPANQEELKLPNIGFTQIIDSGLVPSPPLTPRIEKKTRNFFS